MLEKILGAHPEKSGIISQAEATGDNIELISFLEKHGYTPSDTW